jgi:hypothetical protein
MTHRRVIELMLERYGAKASAGGTEVNALIRPMQYKSGAALNLPTAYYDSLHYLYTGPAELELKTGDKVTAENRGYVVKRSDTVRIGGEDVYVWAVLRLLSPESDTEVYLEADGAKAAIADSYTVQTAQQSCAVAAWGEQEPVGTAAGAVTYEITLKNVCPADGIDLYSLADFHFVITKPGSKTVYSGCRWKNIGAQGGAGNLCCRSMQLTAAKREEQKEAVIGG